MAKQALKERERKKKKIKVKQMMWNCHTDCYLLLFSVFLSCSALSFCHAPAQVHSRFMALLVASVRMPQSTQSYRSARFGMQERSAFEPEDRIQLPERSGILHSTVQEETCANLSPYSIFMMYLWWSSCTLYLLTCQVESLQVIQICVLC